MSQAVKADYVDPILKRYGFNNIEDLYAAITLRATATKVVSKLREVTDRAFRLRSRPSFCSSRSRRRIRKRQRACPKAAWL